MIPQIAHSIPEDPFFKQFDVLENREFPIGSPSPFVSSSELESSAASIRCSATKFLNDIVMWLKARNPCTRRFCLD